MPESPNGEAGLEQRPEEPIQDAKPASESSTEAPKGETKSMLEALQAVSSAKEASPASDKPDSKPGDGAEKSAAEDQNAPKEQDDPDDDELSDDELAKLADKTQRRFRKLVSTNKSLSDEVGSLRTRAESFDRLQTFVQQNKLTQEDVNNTLQIAALMQRDPDQALKALEPIVSALRKATGADLDPELREQVRLGYLTQPAAEEVARARAADRRRLAEEQERQAQAESERRAADLNSQVETAARAADDWYTEAKAKDPDFELKQRRIQDALQLEVLKSKRIPSEIEVKAILGRIKKDVDKEFRALAPKPKEIKPLSGGNASPGGLQPPKTLLEAMQRVRSAG